MSREWVIVAAAWAAIVLCAALLLTVSSVLLQHSHSP